VKQIVGAISNRLSPSWLFITEYPIGMHDLLRDMGRAIVGESSIKEPAKHSRLWFHDDVNDVLLKKNGMNF